MRRHLILVDILRTNTGVFIPQYKTYPNSSLPDGKLCVQMGDFIAWRLTVRTPTTRATMPAFRVVFQDERVIGQAIVEVPRGGNSGFFPVLPLANPGPDIGFKYSIEVPPLGYKDDPEIQMDEGGLFGLPRTKVLHQISANYDPEKGFNRYSADLTVSPGDEVVFKVEGATPDDRIAAIFEEYPFPFEFTEPTNEVSVEGEVTGGVQSAPCFVRSLDPGEGKMFHFIFRSTKFESIGRTLQVGP